MVSDITRRNAVAGLGELAAAAALAAVIVIEHDLAMQEAMGEALSGGSLLPLLWSVPAAFLRAWLKLQERKSCPTRGAAHHNPISNKTTRAGPLRAVDPPSLRLPRHRRRG